MTVTSQRVAAVVTPWTMSPRRRIAPPPMNPIPVRMPRGSRIRSSEANDSGVLPAIGRRRFIWIMATEAARQTSSVVRSPAACPPRSG